MKVRILGDELFVSDCATRLPFRFGSVTMTRATLCVARVRVACESGTEAVGLASDLLVPRWFEKVPTRSPEDDARVLVASARAAAASLRTAGKSERAVFDLWHEVYRDRVASRDPAASDLLVRGFGVALMERALMDAVCRAAGCSFFVALKDDLFGFRPGELHEELAGWSLAGSLPEAPARAVRVRHTVGMADVLRVADVAPDRRVLDGFPQALEEDIAAYGIDCFKVKIGAGRDADIARLLDVAGFLAERFPDLRVELTLDGNEQFEDTADLADLLEEVRRDPLGARLLEGLLAIEQPLHRAATYDAARNQALPRLAAFAPVIIDEADTSLDSFPRALALGYRGISVKNCKGVFRALANRGLCERFPGAFQSAEDLTNLPAVALQQDLCTIAALGLPHAERNGHHYFRGLDHLPPAEVASALQAHPDLYRRTPDGGGALRIEGGRLQLGSLQCPGYGHTIELEEGAPRFRT